MIATLVEIKAALNISGTADDTFLAAQGQLVSDAIEAYCKRKFLKTNYVETFYQDDYVISDKLRLTAFPLIGTATATLDGVALDIDRQHAPTATLIRKDGFHRGAVTVVTYMAGYEQADIPLVVKEVVYAVVGERYNKKTSGIGLNFGNDVQRVSIPGTISVDFDYTLSNNDRSTPFGQLIGSYLNLLDYYRSERAVLGGGNLIFSVES